MSVPEVEYRCADCGKILDLKPSNVLTYVVEVDRCECVDDPPGPDWCEFCEVETKHIEKVEDLKEDLFISREAGREMRKQIAELKEENRKLRG